jgi:hypothetical protein
MHFPSNTYIYALSNEKGKSIFIKEGELAGPRQQNNREKDLREALLN